MWLLTRLGSIRPEGGMASMAVLALTALMATMACSTPPASNAENAAGAASAPAAEAVPAPSPTAETSAPPAAAAETPAPPVAGDAASLPTANPIEASESSIRAGRAIYAKICRACHGLQGKGDGPTAPPGTMPANLVDSEWKYGSSDAALFRTIKLGIEPFDAMRPWGQQLSDDDIWHTINFLRDLANRAG